MQSIQEVKHIGLNEESDIPYIRLGSEKFFLNQIHCYTVTRLAYRSTDEDCILFIEVEEEYDSYRNFLIRGVDRYATEINGLKIGPKDSDMTTWFRIETSYKLKQMKG